MMTFCSFLLPWPTAEIPPNFFCLSSFLEKILHFSLFLDDSDFAMLARVDGEHSLGGRFAVFLANNVPSATICACEITFLAICEFETKIERSGDFSLFSFLNLSNEYRESIVPSTTAEIDESESIGNPIGITIENSDKPKLRTFCAIFPVTFLNTSVDNLFFGPSPAIKILFAGVIPRV